MRAYTKPRYESVTSDAAVQLRVDFERLLQSIERAWHDGSQHLACLNRRVHGDTIFPFYADVWTHFDLRSRTILYLSAVDGEPLDRRSLFDGSYAQRTLSTEDIPAYCEMFPRTYFDHHCDLDFGTGESCKLHLPQLRKCKIEAVLPDRVFFVEYSLRGRRTDLARTYFTVYDDKMLYLDSWDYEEVLALDNDGLCYYIQ